MKIKLHFLHGFLGSSQDWSFLLEGENSFLSQLKISAYKNISYEILTYNIENYMNFIDENENKFHCWCENFHREIFQNSHKNTLFEKNILVGYSLGGRLALHCLLKTNLWDAAVIVSANPGLCHENEKLLRRENDEVWGQRFLTETWENVLTAWNNQGVFSQKKNNLVRKEEQFNRQKIYQMLTQFSLGRQTNLREEISHLKTPILWMTGELDFKFLQIGNEMPGINQKIRHCPIAEAGHRIPWENSLKFTECMYDFIDGLPLEK